MSLAYTSDKNSLKKYLYSCIEKTKYSINYNNFSQFYDTELELNTSVIENLEFLENENRMKRDFFRAKAYRNAIATIKKLNVPVAWLKGIKLPGVGPSIATKIEEIVKTGQLKAIDSSKLQGQVSKEKVIKLFKTIWDVGDVQANSWYANGFRTLKDVEPYLTKTQKISVKYYDDLQKKISRKNIQQLEPILIKTALSLDKNANFAIAGSYRRGLPESGDIDVLLSFEKANNLKSYVQSLKKLGIVVEILKEGEHQITTISKLNDHYGQIDFVLIPKESWGTGILAWTGSQNFNINMRRAAIRKGYKLTQYSLSKYTGEIIYTPTEESVFVALDLPYVEPAKRF